MAIGVIAFIGVSAQTKPKSDSTHRHAGGVPAVTTRPKIDSNTYVFVLNGQQVQLLQSVLAKSTAPFNDVTTLIDLLRQQQFHPPLDTAAKK